MTDKELLNHLLYLLTEQNNDPSDDSDEDSGWIEIMPGIKIHS